MTIACRNCNTLYKMPWHKAKNVCPYCGGRIVEARVGTVLLRLNIFLFVLPVSVLWRLFVYANDNLSGLFKLLSAVLYILIAGILGGLAFTIPIARTAKRYGLLSKKLQKNSNEESNNSDKQ